MTGEPGVSGAEGDISTEGISYAAQKRPIEIEKQDTKEVALAKKIVAAEGEPPNPIRGIEVLAGEPIAPVDSTPATREQVPDDKGRKPEAEQQKTAENNGITPPAAIAPGTAASAEQKTSVGSLEEFTRHFFSNIDLQQKYSIGDKSISGEELHNFLWNMGIIYKERDGNGAPKVGKDGKPIIAYHSNLNKFLSDIGENPGTDADKDRLAQINIWLTGQHAEAVATAFQEENGERFKVLVEKEKEKTLTEDQKNELARIRQQQEANQKSTFANQGAALGLERGRLGRRIDAFVDAFTGEGIEEEKQKVRQYRKVVDAGNAEFRRYRVGKDEGNLRDKFIAFLRRENPMNDEEIKAFEGVLDTKKNNLEAAKKFMHAAGRELLKKRFIRGLLWLWLVIGPASVTILPALLTGKALQMAGKAPR